MALELTSFLVSPVSIPPLRGGPTTPFPAAWGPSVSLHPAIPAEAGLATLLSPRVAKLRSSARLLAGTHSGPGGAPEPPECLVCEPDLVPPYDASRLAPLRRRSAIRITAAAEPGISYCATR